MNSNPKEIVPTQLDILLSTNIPGLKDIAYKPSMTVRNSSDAIVQFNPLYKLNKSIVERMSAGEPRAKQFFQHYSFKSLLRGAPARTLLEATEYGYIDHNIGITLEALFPVKTVIYLNNSPYVIGDVRWTSGDWRIKIEPKRVLVGPNYVSTQKGGGPTVISYEIHIELQLFPGTTVTDAQLKDLKCNANYNSIWKNYSILTGEPYRPTVNYKYYNTSNASYAYSNNESELRNRQRNEEDALKRKHKMEEEKMKRKIQYDKDDLRRSVQNEYDQLRRINDPNEYDAKKYELESMRRRREDEIRMQTNEYDDLVRRNKDDYEELKRRNNEQYEDLKRKNQEARYKLEEKKRSEEMNKGPPAIKRPDQNMDMRKSVRFRGGKRRRTRRKK